MDSDATLSDDGEHGAELDGASFADGTGVLDKSKGEMKGSPTDSMNVPKSAIPVEAGAPAPPGGMDRDGPPAADPVRVLSSLTMAQLREIKQLDMGNLQAYFRELGLRETPEMVERNNLNGSILHMLQEKDVDKMDYASLGEAKAFLMLCNKLASLDRGEQRAEEMIVKDITFWGEKLVWYPGPCDACNRTAFKPYRDPGQRCCDAICCAPKQLVQLPQSRVQLYKDHMTLSRPLWKSPALSDADTYNHDRAFVAPNTAAYQMQIDSIDYSIIYDVDVTCEDEVPPYQYHCADCSKRLCCMTVRREPDNGDYYWIDCCQKMCGYNRAYKQRPSGTITLKLYNIDRPTVFAPITDAQEVATAIQNYMEESRIKKGLRVT